MFEYTVVLVDENGVIKNEASKWPYKSEVPVARESMVDIGVPDCTLFKVEFLYCNKGKTVLVVSPVQVLSTDEVVVLRNVSEMML